jgi:hypothetical protein
LIDISISPGGLINGTIETVHALPVVGEVVDEVGALANSLVGHVGDILAAQSGIPILDTALASGGLIVVDSAAPLDTLHEIHTPQGFTDFGIALELSLDAGGGSVLSASASQTAVPAPLDFPHDGEPTAFHLNVSDAVGHVEEAAQRASADVL